MKEKDKDELSSLLASFKCSRNRDSERFLRKTALKHEMKSISRTYLMMDTDEKRIMGYVTLAFKCLDVKDPNVESDVIELMNLNEGVAQAYLVGQLAKADDAVTGLGKIMLDMAVIRFTKGKDMFGCRMIRLDCKDELIEYYKSNKFQLIAKNEEKDLNQMAIFI